MAVNDLRNPTHSGGDERATQGNRFQDNERKSLIPRANHAHHCLASERSQRGKGLRSEPLHLLQFQSPRNSVAEVLLDVPGTAVGVDISHVGSDEPEAGVRDLCQYLSKRVDDQVSTFMAIKPSDEENPFWVGVIQEPVPGYSGCRAGDDFGILERQAVESACLFQDVARRSGDQIGVTDCSSFLLDPAPEPLVFRYSKRWTIQEPGAMQPDADGNR